MLKKLNVTIPISEETPTLEEKEIKIPLSKIGSRTNMKRLNGFDEKRKVFKYKLFYKEFVKSMIEQLDMLEDGHERKYSYETVLFVAQSVENEFIQERNMSQMKHDAVIEICKKYFNDDIELVESILKLVMPNIIQAHFWRIVRLKTISFFLLVAKALVSQPTP